jgi:ATP-binding cassette subfamily B protein
VLSQGTGYLQEVLNGIKTIQLYSAEDEVKTHYSKFTQGFYKAQSRSNLYDAFLFSCVEGITTIVTAVILWYGAGKILDSAITVGVMIAFIHTLDKIFDPIRDFTMQIASIQRAFAAFEHVEEIYQQELEDEHHLELSTAEQQRLTQFESVEFHDVHFRYGADNPWVLKGVSFTLEKGHQIALVGGTGSGKSTILKLLSRSYDGYEGSIKLNGIELNRIPKATIRNFFAVMQQEVFLFNESIAFNIGLGNRALTPSHIREAARYVYADRFIESLPDQYEFVLRDNGANLSSGQAQLVAFARAVAGGSEVIMLDEATAAVDSVTEQWIQQAIDHVFEDKTVIAIAHRLSTIQHSDQILVLENGQILEQGTHQDLLQINGKYAALYSAMESPENT